MNVALSRAQAGLLVLADTRLFDQDPHGPARHMAEVRDRFRDLGAASGGRARC